MEDLIRDLKVLRRELDVANRDISDLSAVCTQLCRVVAKLHDHYGDPMFGFQEYQKARRYGFATTSAPVPVVDYPINEFDRLSPSALVLSKLTGFVL